MTDGEVMYVGQIASGIARGEEYVLRVRTKEEREAWTGLIRFLLEEGIEYETASVSGRGDVQIRGKKITAVEAGYDRRNGVE